MTDTKTVAEKMFNEICLWVTGKTWEELQPKTPEEKFWAEVWTFQARQEMIHGKAIKRLAYKTKVREDAERKVNIIEKYYPEMLCDCEGTGKKFDPIAGEDYPCPTCSK